MKSKALIELATAACYGPVPAEADPATVVAALASTDRVQRSAASYLLIRMKAARTLALQSLQDLVVTAGLEPAAKNWGLLAVKLLPTKVVVDNPILSAFVYAASQDPDDSLRTNSMSVLGSLARVGDAKAVRLLRTSTRDAYVCVSGNARYYLKRLKRAHP